jgi:ethanolamine utilization protein EutN/carbon dioxide concentrating mechanism protein CcmL
VVLGRVSGQVVSTHKEKLLEGITFLVVEKIDPRTLEGSGDFVVALDAVGAGDGEIVFYAAGSSARMTDVTSGRPADATITAIVEAIEVDGATTYTKGES